MFLRENLGPNTSDAKIRRMSLFACLNVDEGSYARLGLSMRFDCFFVFFLFCFVFLPLYKKFKAYFIVPPSIELWASTYFHLSIYIKTT